MRFADTLIVVVCWQKAKFSQGKCGATGGNLGYFAERKAAMSEGGGA